jgi:hypothetical protein
VVMPVQLGHGRLAAWDLLVHAVTSAWRWRDPARLSASMGELHSAGRRLHVVARVVEL